MPKSGEDQEKGLRRKLWYFSLKLGEDKKKGLHRNLPPFSAWNL